MWLTTSQNQKLKQFTQTTRQSNGSVIVYVSYITRFILKASMNFFCISLRIVKVIMFLREKIDGQCK